MLFVGIQTGRGQGTLHASSISKPNAYVRRFCTVSGTSIQCALLAGVELTMQPMHSLFPVQANKQERSSWWTIDDELVSRVAGASQNSLWSHSHTDFTPLSTEGNRLHQTMQSNWHDRLTTWVVFSLTIERGNAVRDMSLWSSDPFRLERWWPPSLWFIERQKHLSIRIKAKQTGCYI